MASVNDSALDAALNVVNDATRLDICTLEPQTYTEATATFSLGNKTAVSIGAAADRLAGGRQVTVAAFTGGTVTTGGTAAFWALTNPATSTLLATGALVSSKAVSLGVDFDFTEFTIGAEGVSA